VLRLPIPVHCVRGAGATHVFCNRQAIRILKNDGYTKASIMFGRFERELALGSKWADKGFKSFYHFYDTESGAGKWKWPKATQVCGLYSDKAAELWRKARFEDAMFYLGAATHLVQDMCVPHHACCVLTDGHNEYEEWAEENRDLYCAGEVGIYGQANKSGEWVYLNAAYSRKYIDLVRTGSPALDYHAATALLLPRAQQSTAGFWLWFYYEMVKL